MNILLTGASGFIGGRLLQALAARGHQVLCPVRKIPGTLPPGATAMILDFNAAQDPADWKAALKGIDVVINAVGIFQQSPGQTFEVLHRVAPCALFKAASSSKVGRIIQISALGADDRAQTPYHLSKKAADDCLLSLPVHATVVQPSLVYGPGGASAGFFEMMASLPLIPLPGQGRQRIQPVHVDDLVAALCALVETRSREPTRIALVGPVALTLRDFYRQLRAGMGIRRAARFLVIPNPLMATAARFGRVLPGGFLSSDALSMLERGNVADSAATQALLGRSPKGVAEFIPAAYASAVGVTSRMRWLLPVLRLSMAAVWIATGIVSLGLYPVESSYALLARTGTPDWLMPIFLYGAALLDIALGVLALSPRRNRWLWATQAALVLFYTVVITVKIPEFWLHPYGPILKNLPFLAGLWILYELEDRS